MKRIDWRRAALLAAPGGLLAAFALGGGSWLWATLDPAERDTLAAVLHSRGMLLVMVGLALWALAAWGLERLYRQHVTAAAQLLEQARSRTGEQVAMPLEPAGSPPLRGLAEVLNTLVQQRSDLHGQMAAKVAEAARHIDQERQRLAALMSELTQAVVVCNLDGRILLYNERARAQFRALSRTPALAGGAELIGLGRSIHGVFERRLVAHALETLRLRLQQGTAQPTAQFVTSTVGGQLLRAVMAPVRAAQGEAQAMQGFVLLLDNITREFEQESARDAQLHAFTEGTRASLGNLQAAVEMLELPDLEPAMRERFQAVVHDEVQGMGRRVAELAARGAQELRTRWPLEDMLGADVVSAAQRRLQALGLRVSCHEVDATLWLKVDSFSLLQALASLAQRLAEAYDIQLVELRLSRAGSGPRAQLDLLWTGQAMSTETAVGWETEPLRVGADGSALTVRDVVQRHGAEFWFERERARHAAFFRFLLPLAGAPSAAEAPAFAPGDSRPEYYDFDLFAHGESSRALDERPLLELSYTVFDTETTGLNPSQGDEILQIGATRIVAGKLRRQECFDQLVDPQRDIPAAGIPIHGIEPRMVQGQPTIDTVLPAFHAFAQDTVLVGHNAAFDMRFLQLKEPRTGLRFEQPVLDTLLLAAAAQPQQESQALESIAARLGVAVAGRHTALGDALVTAEVFLKLIPLLQAQGIHTLGQAREASQKTLYARLKY